MKSNAEQTMADPDPGRSPIRPHPAIANTPERKWDIGALRTEMLRQLGDDADAYPGQLEHHFPHVLARITALWGSPEMDTYFESLLVSDRPGRQGFPPDVAMEIFRVSIIHGALRLTQEPAARGWFNVSDRDVERWRQRRS
jgi:hypothetical protein